MCPTPMGESVGLLFLPKVAPSGQRTAGFWNEDVEDEAFKNNGHDDYMALKKDNFYLKNDEYDYGPACESQGRCGGEQYVLHLQVLAHL